MKRTSIFSDPRGWGQQMVGPRLQYRLAQATCVTTTFAILSIFLAATKGSAHDAEWWLMFTSTCIMVISGVIVWPLMLLRSLRAWLPPAADKRGFEVITGQADT